VSGTMVAIVAAGTCSITASQTGNASYLAATSVAQGFAVTLAANGGGVITTVAGNGISLPFPYTPDYGGPATSTWLSAPQGVAVDASGNLSLRTPWVSRRCRPAASSVHSRATL
jgi:hypothetical protein